MPLRVLAIDDDARLVELLRSYLTQNGVLLESAPDGPHGLAALEAGSFDAVLLDVMMPGMDGIEVCRQIDHRTTKVLMLTAREDLATRDASAAAGADAFLAKPFSAVELLDAIERLSADEPSG